MTNTKLFSNLTSFGTRYCGGKQITIPTPRGLRSIWKFDGATNLSELRNLLKPFTIRRLKSQVLTDLPDKRREFLYIDLPKTFRTKYLDIEKKLIWELGGLKAGAGLQSIDILALLGRLRHVVGLAKADVAKEYIQQFVDSGDKLLVFGHHHDVLDNLEIYLKKERISYVRADGSTNAENRDKAITKFQTDEKCLVFLATTAMGMGVTLTAASNALFIERQWSPSVEEQMEDRVHRIGQKRGVIIWYIQIEGTIDERMAKVVERKRDVITAILDDDRGQSIESSNLIDEVLQSYI
jgi:SWI/SNF-related matrix-associated actin-dependent regulator 1 of chromatin subfamily A